MECQPSPLQPSTSSTNRNSYIFTNRRPSLLSVPEEDASSSSHQNHQIRASVSLCGDVIQVGSPNDVTQAAPPSDVMPVRPPYDVIQVGHPYNDTIHYPDPVREPAYLHQAHNYCHVGDNRQSGAVTHITESRQYINNRNHNAGLYGLTDELQPVYMNAPLRSAPPAYDASYASLPNVRSPLLPVNQSRDSHPIVASHSRGNEPSDDTKENFPFMTNC